MIYLKLKMNLLLAEAKGCKRPQYDSSEQQPNRYFSPISSLAAKYATKRRCDGGVTPLLSKVLLEA